MGLNKDKPSDERSVLCRCPDAENGWIVGFWNGEDWFESEASSHSLTEIHGPITGWVELPPHKTGD